MNIYRENMEFSRRQFFKGSGLLFAAAVASAVFGKIGYDSIKINHQYVEKRAAAVYSLDESMALRKSHENPEVLQIYKEFLSPGSVTPLTEKSEMLLHTKYGKEIPGLIAELKSHDEAAA